MHGKGAWTYSPPGACSSCLAQTLRHKHINAGVDKMLECADGTSSGANVMITGMDAMTRGINDNFAYAYVYSPSADVCTTSADIIKSWPEN